MFGCALQPLLQLCVANYVFIYSNFHKMAHDNKKKNYQLGKYVIGQFPTVLYKSPCIKKILWVKIINLYDYNIKLTIIFTFAEKWSRSCLEDSYKLLISISSNKKSQAASIHCPLDKDLLAGKRWTLHSYSLVLSLAEYVQHWWVNNSHLAILQGSQLHEFL